MTKIKIKSLSELPEDLQHKYEYYLSEEIILKRFINKKDYNKIYSRIGEIITKEDIILSKLYTKLIEEACQNNNLKNFSYDDKSPFNQRVKELKRLVNE